MTAIVATPPKVLLNEQTRALHLETCPTVKTGRHDRYTRLFTGWSSRDVAIIVTGRNLHPCRNCKPLTRLAGWEHHHPASAEAAALAEVVTRHRFPDLTKPALCNVLAALLAPARRDVQLTMGGSVDLLVGRIAIEVTTTTPLDDLEHQLLRHSHSPEFSGVLVVSTAAEHEQLPDMIGGKPVHVALAKPL